MRVSDPGYQNHAVFLELDRHVAFYKELAHSVFLWVQMGTSGIFNLDVLPKLATEEILRRGDWNDFVNRPMTEGEVESIRLSIRRGHPFGSEA